MEPMSPALILLRHIQEKKMFSNYTDIEIYTDKADYCLFLMKICNKKLYKSDIVKN